MAKNNNSKSPIKLRRKKLSNGEESLYLDIYFNGQRKYEYLKLYIRKATTPEQRDINKRTILAAEQIKSQRLMDLMDNSSEFFAKTSKQRYNIVDFIRSLSDTKIYSKIIPAITNNNGNVLWSEISTNKKMEEYIEKVFGDYKPTTKMIYTRYFRSVVKQAQKKGIIPMEIEIHTKKVDAERKFLTLDEIKLLYNTDCNDKNLKNAFLFSCFSGLRISDVRKLKWQDISILDGYTRITFYQKKTKSLEYMDISEQAVYFINQQDKTSEYVFTLGSDLRYQLGKWIKKAGIDKHITFHCARHTFAILMIELGTDLFVVSKLLGHKEIQTTQIYAKVLDKTKREAIDKIPKITNIIP